MAIKKENENANFKIALSRISLCNRLSHRCVDVMILSNNAMHLSFKI